MREAHWRRTHSVNEDGTWQGPNDRVLGTLFGKVRYWRTYLYRNGASIYPLDIELEFPLDGFSMGARSYVVKLATKMSDLAGAGPDPSAQQNPGTGRAGIVCCGHRL
jgi:hypothetical protein